MVAETVVETREVGSVVEALALIDDGLSKLQGRELISTNEVADLLLDVRTILAAADTTDAALPEDPLPIASN
jgi:hypothetical protein